MTGLPRNVIHFEPKTAASKARVATHTTTAVRQMRAADCQREAESEQDKAKDRALADLMFAMEKAYAVFGAPAKTWIQTTHAGVMARYRYDDLTDRAHIDRCKASHGRELIATGIDMIREAEGNGRAAWVLENHLERITG